MIVQSKKYDLSLNLPHSSLTWMVNLLREMFFLDYYVFVETSHKIVTLLDLGLR
jgi:hypothetical protein